MIQDADESIKFWSGIWDNETEHNNEAEWLNEIKQGIGHLNQKNLKLNKEDITKQCKKIPNWKAPGSAAERFCGARGKIYFWGP